MAMNNFDKGTFRFSETFNNSNGKTSGSGFIGVILGMVTALSWIGLMLAFFFSDISGDKIVEMTSQALALGGVSALLLGARKVAGAFDKKKEYEDEDEDLG